MIKVKIETEEGIVEQPIDFATLKKWIEDGILTAEDEIWSDILTGNEWKKLGELTIYQKIINKEVDKFGISESLKAESSSEDENIAQNTKAYGIPIGALIAVISFFLPWFKISCNGYAVSKTGADMANWDGTFWLILLAAIAIIFFYFYYSSQNKIEKCKTSTIISCVVVILVAIFKWVSGIRIHTEWGDFNFKISDMKGVTLEIGIFGVFLGFIISFISALALPSSVEIPTKETPFITSQSKFCVNCGNKLKPDDKFCSNCGKKREEYR